MGFTGLSSQQGFSRRRADSVDVRRSEHLSLAAYSAAGEKIGGLGYRDAAAPRSWTAQPSLELSDSIYM
jgi:hypothetical protein